MCAAGQKHLDVVFVLRLHAFEALAAAVLCVVGVRWNAFNVTRGGDRNHADFASDEIFHVDFGFARNDERTARIGIFCFDVDEFGADDTDDFIAGGKQFVVVFDLALQFGMFGLQLFDDQTRQLEETHIQNGFRLAVAEEETLHQRRGGDVTVRGVADDMDDFVDVRLCDEQALDDVVALFCDAQFVFRTAGDNFFAMIEIRFENLLEVERARAVFVNDQELGGQRRFQRRHRIELIENDGAHGAALHIDDDADTDFGGGDIGDVRDADDAFLVDEIGDLLDHLFFIDGIRDFRDDDLLFAVGFFNGRLAAQMDGATARLIELDDGIDALDDAARREIRTRQPTHQFTDGNARVVDEGNGRVNDFTKIVRRDVGGHTDTDTSAAVDENVRETGGQDGRLDARLVEVWEHIDGVFFKIRKKFFRKTFETAFRVSVSGRWVAVDGTEVTLAFDERAAHVEILRHAG